MKFVDVTDNIAVNYFCITGLSLLLSSFFLLLLFPLLSLSFSVSLSPSFSPKVRDSDGSILRLDGLNISKTQFLSPKQMSFLEAKVQHKLTFSLLLSPRPSILPPSFFVFFPPFLISILFSSN